MLALVAENPGVPADMLKQILGGVASPQVRRIAVRLNSGQLRGQSRSVARAVRGLRRWAERNRLVHSPRRSETDR